MRAMVPFVLLGSGCFGSVDTPFDPGLEPLEAMAVDAPMDLAEDFAVRVEEGPDHHWGHLRGHIHQDLATVWRAFQDPDVAANRRRLARWDPTFDVEPEYDFSMSLDILVEDIIDVEYVLVWRHGAVGDPEEPDKVSMRWQKTEGSALIDVLRGSVVLLPTDEAGITEVQMIEHLKAPMAQPEEVESLLTDVFLDAVEASHGRPLPVYDED